MPLFMPDEELARLSSDAASVVAERADEYIRKIYAELDSVRAKADAASITAEQTCSLLEQKYLSLSQDFSSLESQNAKLQSDFDDRLAELAQSQAQKHQLHLQSIEKDGEVERMTTEISELHKSKRQLMELLEQKDAEISEKNSTIKSYLDKIVKLTDTCSEKESRLAEASAELARSQAMCSRLSQVMKPSLNDSHSGTSELENRVVEESPQPETMEQREARRDREMQQMREMLQSMQTMLQNLTMGEARSAPLQGSFTIIERMEEVTKNTIDGFLHILNTGSEEELIKLKGFGEKNMKKVLERRRIRPITKVKDLDPEFTFKQFNVRLMQSLKNELDRKERESR